MNWDLLATYVARAVALLTAIPVHESAHAWASDKLGDPTAKRYGRLSLNPLRHFDFLGALCMIFVGFGWAKPVPIAAATNFRHPRRDMALSAAAGPASNLLLAFLCMIFYKLVYYLAPGTQGWIFVSAVLFQMVWTNITLAVFNLMPCLLYTSCWKRCAPACLKMKMERMRTSASVWRSSAAPT